MNVKKESTVLLKCKADKIEEFKVAVKELIKETVKEPGCELFKIFQVEDKPDHFVLWEVFKNQTALDIHMESNHTKTCFALGLFDPISLTHHTEV